MKNIIQNIPPMPCMSGPPMPPYIAIICCIIIGFY